MPRYFYHITNGTRHHDDEGTELPNLEEARRQGMEAAGEMVNNDPHIWRHKDWNIEIADAEGQTLLTLLFSLREIRHA